MPAGTPQGCCHTSEQPEPPVLTRTGAHTPESTPVSGCPASVVGGVVPEVEPPLDVVDPPDDDEAPEEEPDVPLVP